MPLPRNMDVVPIEPMQVDLPENDVLGRQEHVFVVENPNLDLETYASSYKGLGKLHRLLFIAKHCPTYAVDALRLAASAVRNTHNTDMYREIMQKLNQALTQDEGGDDGLAQGQLPDLDMQWVETTNKRAQMKLDKFDQDLKTYKNNSIKESIRRGHDDLGDHYLDCGDLCNALKCYSRARDYCISAQHIINMCMNVIQVSIYLQNWPHVQTYVNKAEAVPDVFDSASGTANEKTKKANMGTFTKLKCSSGLAELAQKQYKSAARLFLQASFDHFQYTEVMSAHDVALYGGLCALASFDREELHKKVLSSSSFKLFLELDPQLRDILHKFYASKYGSCMALLQQMKDNLLLDMFLSPHVNNLYTKIRNRALIQYFSPYMSADLNKMASAFNTTVAELEDELTSLILDGQISARIDSQNKILHARDIDHRSTTFEKALQAGKEYQWRTRALILRTVVIKNHIQVKAVPRDDEAGTSR